MKKSTWQHLRIPFSLFLMPVYLFAWSVAPSVDWANAFISFIAIHLFLYPASNGFNSYFDKDEESIGGVEKPLPVSKELYWVSLLWDGAALLLGAFVSWQFALMLLIYGLISKAYSHPTFRLKKFAIAGWLTVGIFQGFFTFWLSNMAISGAGFKAIAQAEVLVPALLSLLLLLGSYPMTQVYQHQEDAKRGDRTMSLLLGIRGTFWFTLIFFAFSGAGFIAYYFTSHSVLSVACFIIATLPVTTYFVGWMKKVWADEAKADFKHTMRLNLISSACFIVLFLLTGILHHWG